MVRVTPGVEAHTHDFVRTGQEDSKFGFGLASGAAAEAVARVRALPGLELVGIHAHIGSQVFRVDSFARGGGGAGGVLRPARACASCASAAGSASRTSAGRRAPSIAEWAQTVHDACRRAGIPADTLITAEPGRSIVAARRRSRCTGSGRSRSCPGVRTYVAVDGGMSDNPRPVLYGSGYEAFLPREAARPAPAGGPGRGQALRVR